MSQFIVHQFKCLEDNFGFLIHDKQTGETASIDAPDGQAVADQLEKNGWNLTHIFSTHHHADHVDGNLFLKERFGCQIIGPKNEASKIPGIDVEVSGGEKFNWANRQVHVFDCPGHTLGHISFYIPSENTLFSADTLFALGCGRVFEGTMEQMFHSVNQFKALPSNTQVFFGHEYTELNCKFALTIDPDNRDLNARAKEIFAKRARGEMTCPTTIAEELKTNPFLRSDSHAIRQGLGLENASDAEVFTEIRNRRNRFKL